MADEEPSSKLHWVNFQKGLKMLEKKVSLHTFGCRLNMSETGAIADLFAQKGYKIVPFGEPSDIVYINTCTVTDGADSSCRNLIRKANKTSPGAKIVVVGCYAQMAPEELAEMKGVDLILGTSEKHKIFDYLEESDKQIIKVDKTNEFWGAATTPADSHTRAFLKIQDGCNYICSFCIIPQARGRSRAISTQEAISSAKKLIGQGFQEIVLTGVNIGEYEHSSGEKLSDLLKGLLSLEGLKRLRLSSVEPNTVSDELISILKDSSKFMHHFHIPLQSGDDSILKMMRRRYTISDYEKIIEKLIKNFPNAAIGADAICGFPGETEAQFENTYNIMKDLPITHFHVFPYSKRQNTMAASMDNHIHEFSKKERVQRLLELGDLKLETFSQDQLGTKSEVLFEQKNAKGLWTGYTENYIKVYLNTQENLKGRIEKVFLNDFCNKKLFAQLLH